MTEGSETPAVRLLNLTPHALTVAVQGAGSVTLPPSGEPVRLPDRMEHHRAVTTSAGDITVSTLPRTQAADGLPAPEPGVAYVVSRVAAAATDRDDVLFPLGERRDSTGRITDVEGLGAFAASRPRLRPGFTSRVGLFDRFATERWIGIGLAVATASLSAAAGVVPDLAQDGWDQGPRLVSFLLFAVLGLATILLSGVLLRHRATLRKRRGTAYVVDLQAAKWTHEERNSFLADVRLSFASTFEIVGPRDWDSSWTWELGARLEEWDEHVDDVVKCFWAALHNDDELTRNGVFLWCWWPVAMVFALRVMRGRRGLELDVRRRPTFGRADVSKVDWRRHEGHSFQEDGAALLASRTNVRILTSSVRVDVRTATSDHEREDCSPLVVVLLRFTLTPWGPLRADWMPSPGEIPQITVTSCAVPGVSSGSATLVECRYVGVGAIPWEDFPLLAESAAEIIQTTHEQHPTATLLVGATMPQEVPFGLGVRASRRESRGMWPDHIWPLIWSEHAFVVPRLDLGRARQDQAAR